jgi:hypothetical protein
MISYEGKDNFHYKCTYFAKQKYETHISEVFWLVRKQNEEGPLMAENDMVDWDCESRYLCNAL